jgi:receptor protein-tyrosine kinase
MLIPKASHLVERVAERLLRSGDLDGSTARLLGQTDGPAAADANESDADQRQALPAAASAKPLAPPVPAPEGTSVPPASPPTVAEVAPVKVAAALAQRSSLFAPPPSAARPVSPLPAAKPLLSPAAPMVGALVSPGGRRAAASSDGAPATAAPILPAPAIPPGQARVLEQRAGQAGSLDVAPDFSSSTPFPTLRGGLADPAAGMLQGPASVDAVSLERAGMVDWSRTRTRISEEFRLVQRQIMRSAFGPGAEPGFSNLLLVTSSRPGEGKSFMATNLAGSIARQGDHHVLLVDSDSKRDSICYSLGLAQARGLLDLAANPKLDPAPLIVKTPIERLSILPVGRERERSAELFSTKEMTRLIQSLGRRYADRLLILDAPPCLSTSDPAVLAQVVGQILFVVEADRTQRDEIEASLDLIQACPTITMVLNKQQISSRYTFGAYSSYYSS